MARLARKWRERGQSIGFVPTMGALHAGHASLISRAGRENRRVVVSLFVNPSQFGPGEDFGRYPRPFAADRGLCASLGADALYHPSAREVYPQGFSTWVAVEGLSEPLCGKFRPGHFRGVATVVLKLLETVRPDRAYFGEKDFQQLVLIRKMARDLGLDARIVGCPTIREADGLALSSRNRYLSPAERAAAPLLYAALRAGAETARRANRPGGVLAAARAGIRGIPGVAIDYVSLVDPSTLRETRTLSSKKLRLLAAIRVGKTRLIDNIPVLMG